MSEWRCNDPECLEDYCITECYCGRGRYPRCQYSSCYECFLDRRADHVSCVFCGKWHSPQFDTCFKCRPETRGRDDAALALRQLILARDSYTCQNCDAREGDVQVDPRRSRPACLPICYLTHEHRLTDDPGLIHATLQVDHIVPCAKGGTADEWNLHVLCGLCNAAKGAAWYVGCRYEDWRTELCRKYFLIG